jgi:FKBP-type peptidyl-prolyl cis-trans isomerase SlyD
MSSTSIQPNSLVVLEYTLKDDDGDVLDASDAEDGAPIEYVHGYGMLVPGLEAALTGMSEGESREILVPAESGYGEYDDELVLELDRKEFPDPTKVKVGDEFVAESPDGDELPMEVIEIKDDVVVVDANHPLAGVTLHYAVKVRSVREATTEEIEKAASELEDARGHVHGEDCDHDHSHDELVTLGKKSATVDAASALETGKKKPGLLN